MTDKEAFVDMIQANEGIIYKIVRLYSGRAGEDDDLYQEIVYQLWKSIASFKNYSKISTWIYKVALNTAIGQMNKANRVLPTIQVAEVTSAIPDRDDENRKEQIERLYDAIKKLNPADKAVILLFLEGNSYEEMALITGFSSSNIGTRLSRIKEKLRLYI